MKERCTWEGRRIVFTDLIPPSVRKIMWPPTPLSQPLPPSSSPMLRGPSIPRPLPKRPPKTKRLRRRRQALEPRPVAVSARGVQWSRQLDSMA